MHCLLRQQVLDGTNCDRATRAEVMDTFGRQHQIRVLFIECVCDDEDLLESNTKVSIGLTNTERANFSSGFRSRESEAAERFATGFPPRLLGTLRRLYICR